MTTIAISGASGQLGAAVAEHLAGRVDAADLVLLTRSPERLAAWSQRGADVRRADFADADGLRAALAGVDRLLLISTDVIGPGRVELHRAAVDAARAAGVAHVLYTSGGNPVPDNPALAMPDHRATEAALRDSGLAWTFLRNGVYAELEVPGAQQALASGQLVANTGEGRTAYVSRDDLAAAAAAVLASEGHEGQVYDLTGPELLSAADRAALVAELGGRPVEPVLIDDAAMLAGLAQAGLPPEAAQVIVSFGAAIRDGFLDQRTDAIERLTGRPPRPLREVLAGAGIGAPTPSA